MWLIERLVQPEGMPVCVTCAAKGATLYCPKCDTLVLNKSGEQLVTDVSQARAGGPHLWCTACLSQCIINSLRTPAGIFCCPRESCRRQILEFDTHRCHVAAPDPSGPAPPKKRRAAWAKPDITFASSHLGDPDRVLAPSAVRDFMALPENRGTTPTPMGLSRYPLARPPPSLTQPGIPSASLY